MLFAGHINRKIAVGFSPAVISEEDIMKIGLGYITFNENSFQKTENTLPEILKMYEECWSFYQESQKEGRRIDHAIINETLINCMINPSYILILKDSEKIDAKTWKRAKKLSRLNNLPIVVYDKYQIERTSSQTTVTLETTEGEVVKCEGLPKLSLEQIKEMVEDVPITFIDKWEEWVKRIRRTKEKGKNMDAR